MSFFKKLFGGGNGEDKASNVVAEVTHAGFHIAVTPMPEGGQYRVCALITKEIDGDVREHKLIRADLCATTQEASELAVYKAKQVIDQRGDAIFG